MTNSELTILAFPLIGSIIVAVAVWGVTTGSVRRSLKTRLTAPPEFAPPELIHRAARPYATQQDATQAAKDMIRQGDFMTARFGPVAYTLSPGLARDAPAKESEVRQRQEKPRPRKINTRRKAQT